MGNRLVLVGGGHAHMTALLKIGEYLERGHRATLISKDPYHFYSGMGPGLLSGIYHPREVCFHVRKMAEAQGARFIRDRVVRVDPEGRKLHLESGGLEHYDVVSFNTGSEVPLDTLNLKKGEGRVFPVKPIENLLKARDLVVGSQEGGDLRIAVIGGGPAGVEVSANLWRLLRDHRISGNITLADGGGILSGFPARVSGYARESLLRRRITLIEGDYVTSIEGDRVSFKSGNTLSCHMVLIAAGVSPSPLFADSGIPTGPDGGLLVNRVLQSVAYPEIFGGGDCITLEGTSLARVGVYAVRQNPVLHHNLKAALDGESLMPFDPGGAYLLILNMGDGRGILWKKSLVWEGKLAFMAKDFIDRRFMRTFQVSGELSEQG